MSDSSYRYPPGMDTPIARDAGGAVQGAGPSDQKSVPDGPARPRGERRQMGPGSTAGTLCADPEIKFTDRGTAMVKLRLAVSRRVKDDATGDWVDGPTEYVDAVVWGRQGENIADELRKGDRVVCIGSWQEDRYMGRDEQWHTSKTLTVREIGPSVLFRQARVVRAQERSGT